MSKRQKPLKERPPKGERRIDEGAPKVQIPTKPKPPPPKKGSSGSSNK